MNISFIEPDRMSPNSYANVNEGTASQNAAVSQNRSDSGYRLDISSFVTDNNAYKDQGRSIEEVMLEAGNLDVSAYRDYMVVMSNCLSTEDYTALQRDGIDPGNTNFDEVVSIVDHIKTALIKGGTQVVGYTDDISKETLESITGSKAYANELADAFSKKDVPLTKDNAAAVEEGFKQLSEASPLGEGKIKYMVENNLKPTVDNIYKAAFSGGYDASRQSHGYYNAGEVDGYYAKKSENADIEELMPQIKGVIKDAGLEVTDENIDRAKWLIEKGIPLTADTLDTYGKIDSLNLPMSHKEFAEHAVNALVDGISINKADLSRNISFRQEANEIYNEVNTSGTIKGRRVLEEVRLTMTVEANLKLLKSGYRIDTAPMEDLIKNLKKAEEQIAKSLTGEKEPSKAIEKKNNYEDAVNILASLKTAPISISYEMEMTDTLRQIDVKAENLKASYVKAGQSYETLMTAPRADLGDSIKKAFSNVDSLLNEMDEALTDENRRAVRILGYNGMEINEENIQSVKEKDKILTDTIENLTPGRVLSMIRSGINPVTMPIQELDSFLKDQDTTASDMMSYSKFLYKLEKDNEITAEEKEAYIGIYRLVRQIEKNDFATVGAIENMNVTYSLDNMLSALRSKKHKAMDYKIDDSFAGVDVRQTGIESISSQIAKGFITDTNDLKNMLGDQGDPESEREYEKQLLEEMRRTVKTESEILEQLSRSSIEITPENIAGTEAVLQSPMNVFTRLKELGFKKEIKDFPDSKEKAIGTFKEFTGSIKDFLKNEVFGQGSGQLDLNSENIKRVSRIYSHMDFLERRSEEEDYSIPTVIGNENVAINLKVIHTGSGEQEVAISFGSAVYGNVTAKFHSGEDGLSGFCNLDNKEMTTLLENNKEVLKAGLKDNDIELKEVYFVNSNSVNLYQFNLKQTTQVQADTDVVTTDSLYKAAKEFISFMNGMAAERI
ncbi:MAG: DUF6240 domain-containing protein [Lachnospiraceae bacterium]|nr:DUF6240 domain-containing protein [Lachnospiraceae bacterium]